MKTGRPASRDSSRQEISGFVLAGGKSSRLGQDKVLLPWNGHTLLEHAIERLAQVCASVHVCADRDDLQPSVNTCIRDAVSAAGPLGGIVAALEYSQTSWNFLLAVDLPLVPVAFLRALIEQLEVANAQPSPWCILPEIDGRPQPLCGLYHRRLLSGLGRALLEGRYKIMLALDETLGGIACTPGSGLKLISADDLAAGRKNNLCPGDFFFNINTPQDWQRTRELATYLKEA